MVKSSGFDIDLWYIIFKKSITIMIIKAENLVDP